MEGEERNQLLVTCVIFLPSCLLNAHVHSCEKLSLKKRKKYGKFSLLVYLIGFEGNIWCNWMVWAGSKQHILIYITGFKIDDLRDKKILFSMEFLHLQRTSACWRQEIHAFATYAKGVHLVLLMRYSASSRRGGFSGQYYVLKQSEMRPYSIEATGSVMFVPQPSLLASANIPQLYKERLLLKLDDAHSHVSAKHRTDQVTELNET